MAKVEGVGELNRILGVMAKFIGKTTRPTVKLGYSAPYALYVHEDLEMRHKPPTQAKYLETPMRLLRPELSAMIRGDVKGGIPVDLALLKAASMIMDASQLLVPVDTGRLKSSGYVTLE